MLNITFKEIDKEIEKQIVEIWGTGYWNGAAYIMVTAAIP